MTTETIPDRQQTRPRPSRGARGVGYLLGAAINVALIWLINVPPGWRWLPFLTDDFSRVVGLVTASLVVGFVINVIYVTFMASPTAASSGSASRGRSAIPSHGGAAPGR